MFQTSAKPMPRNLTLIAGCGISSSADLDMGALLDAQRGSPGSFPSRGRQAVPARARAAAEVGRAKPPDRRRRRHRHQPAHVAVQTEKRVELLRRDARLRRLAREVDLDERGNRELRRRRFRVERVAQLAQRIDGLRLPALQVADEVPAERSAVARVLRLEVLRAVLSDDLDARVDENPQLVDREVLRRDDDRHCGPNLVLQRGVAFRDLVRGRRQ